MCCEARGNGNGSGANGACLVFFRFMAVLATIGGITLVAIGASSWGRRELEHSQEVQAYLNAVSDFPSPWTSTTALPEATLQQGNRTNKFSPQSTIVVPLDGQSPEVNPVQTRLLATTVFPFESSVPLNLTVYHPNASKQVVDSITLMVPYTKMLTQPISCSPSACATACETEGMMCSDVSLGKACQAQFNLLATYLGDAQCNNGDFCGNCYVEGYLTTACFVVAPTDDGSYVFDRTMQSCFYPFTADAQLYTVSDRETVTVQLRVNSDPFISLQRTTQGSMTFPTASVQGPAVLVGIGIALIVSFWCGLGCHRACTRSRRVDRVEEEMVPQGISRDGALPLAPYPAAPQGVPVPMPMQQPPVEGVFYAQGPMPLNQAPPFAVRSDPPHVVDSGSENYPGVPMKPLQR